MNNLLIINPLGFALAHYQNEISSIFFKFPIHLRFSSQPEPSQDGSSRLSWVISNFFKAYKETKAADSVLTLWPILGYYDLLIYPKILGGKELHWIMHDPQPLTKAIGYGKFSKFIVSHLAKHKNVTIIVHSSGAKSMIPYKLKELVSVLPHPILTNIPNKKEAISNRRKNIRVLGQYKRDRDIQILELISRLQFKHKINFEISGKNWPIIEGWNVDSNFLTELNFKNLLYSTDIVLIPYKFFFQSGIAIRCLEERVPFMISENDFSKTLLGEESLFLLSGNLNLKIETILSSNVKPFLDSLYTSYTSNTISSWSNFFMRKN